MSDIKIKPSATGSATVTLTAPATGTARTVTLPDGTGTLIADNGSGSVGIGETTPLAKLHIKRGDSGLSSLNAAGDHIFLENTGANGTGITLASGNTANGSIIFGDQDSNYRGVLIYDHSADAMKIVTAGSERMRIDSSGKVGIGTTSPSVNVHIVDDASEGTPTFAGATHFAVQATASSSDNVNASLISGTAGVSRLMFGHKNDEDVGLIQHSHSTGKMSFKVNGVSDVMTIDNYGRILIGTATDASVNPNGLSVRASSYGLYACKISHSAGTGDGAGILIDIENYSASNGQTMIRFDTSAGQVGSIKSNQNSTAYNTSSDYRLKENVDYTWDATTRLKQLKPARFNFKNDDTNTLIDGFIAHEVSSVVPEAISGVKDAVDSDGNIDPQGIDQSKLVPLLVKTIQELEARITTLEG